MSVRIAVHGHVTIDYLANEAVTYFTVAPVKAAGLAIPERTQNRAARSLNYARTKSRLLGTIIAPDGTETYSAWGVIDMVRQCGTMDPIPLSAAMNHTKHGCRGLRWEPATACTLEERRHHGDVGIRRQGRRP